MKGLNNYSIGFIFEHRKMVSLLENITEKKVPLDEMITTKDILGRFTKEVSTGKNQMTEDSFRAIMGLPSTNPALVFGMSGPENEKVNWSGYLGAFNRLSLAPKNVEAWKAEKDIRRYNACKQFYYDGDGKLRTGK